MGVSRPPPLVAGQLVSSRPLFGVLPRAGFGQGAGELVAAVGVVAFARSVAVAVVVVVVVVVAVVVVVVVDAIFVVQPAAAVPGRSRLPTAAVVARPAAAVPGCCRPIDVVVVVIDVAVVVVVVVVVVRGRIGVRPRGAGWLLPICY